MNMKKYIYELIYNYVLFAILHKSFFFFQLNMIKLIYTQIEISQYTISSASYIHSNYDRQQ